MGVANSNQTNRYLQLNQPWALAREDAKQTEFLRLRADGTLISDVNRVRINRTVYHCAETLRIVGILLQPFMPSKAAELLDMMGVDPSRRTYNDAALGADFTYGTPTVDVGKGAFEGLFPPLAVET